ncbi:progesterone receptor isoform X1 [Boleophthalmus pectinirostris]|uniref:progesterone receptor isoform X1 n=2 Tax=Boleophthalmus pectinirostris TaxID=150288 RepID=UPI0024325ACF|nr:progesterone receptor isoform X1 [Boleophthalmus pectinirostris]
MENKLEGRMSDISTAIVDSTETRGSASIENGYSNIKLTNNEVHFLSSVRNYGSTGALVHSVNVSGSGEPVFKEFNLLDAPATSKPFLDRGNSEYLKCDSVPWEDFVKRTSAAANQSAILSTSCKYIKDEKEPSVIMNSPCTSFDAPADLSALDTCCEPQRKQPLGLPESEPNTYSPGAPRSVQDGSTNFLIDLSSSDPLVQVRTESRSSLSGKPLVSFDVSAHTSPPQHSQAMFKSEVSRWPMHTTPVEPHFWSQSQGVSEEPYTHAPYESIPSQSLVQRNPSPFSTFPGMPPQRQCVICGDEASGCHYGVLTCGSCKVFFKRAVEGHHSYLCAGRNDCIVDKIRRKNCPACRLRKCYQAGMMLGGRKLKRFGALKALGLSPSLMFQSHLAMSGENQALNSMSCIPGIRDVQLSHQIISILENIEPEIVYAGYDNTQPEVPHILLNSLNRLCEKQLLWIVKWSKSLPGFRNLHINDQMTLIQYSWMNLMVFSLGWRTFQNVTSEYLYFAPDLVLSQEQMRRSPIYDLCLAIQFIPQEFANLQVTRDEFLCMKAIILLNTVPLEGLKSQAAFEEMRQSYIRELSKIIHLKEKGVVATSQRFYHLTKLMDAMHDIVKKVNLYCLSTFIQADAMKVEFPEMMSEVIASQLPKVLAGMVRPLLFHTK